MKEERSQELNHSQNARTATAELYQGRTVTEHILARILKIKQQQLDLAAKEKEFLVQCNKELSKEVDDLRVEKSQLLEKTISLKYGLEK